jgi:integrase
MIAAGIHPKRLSSWLGHTSVALTMDRYGHLYDDDEGAPAAMDALHGDRPAGPRSMGRTGSDA